jgi:hypothetical protein
MFFSPSAMTVGNWWSVPGSRCVALSLLDGNSYAQHSIPEFRARLVSLGSFGQLNRPIERAVSALGPADFAVGVLFLDFPFATNDEYVIIDLNCDVLVGEAGQFGRDDQITVLLGNLDCRYPGDIVAPGKST